MTPANTLIILSDEHQTRAMGCAGHPFVRTPNLDRLAGRGLRFTNAVTPSPICVPARATFATGQPVYRCRYWDNSIAYDGRVRGWGHALQEAGVPVESIGKLHYQKENLPTGFDAEHIPMHLYKGVGMVWASIRDPLPERRPTSMRMLGARRAGHSCCRDQIGDDRLEVRPVIGSLQPRETTPSRGRFQKSGAGTPRPRRSVFTQPWPATASPSGC